MVHTCSQILEIHGPLHLVFGHLETAPVLSHAASDPYDHDQMSFPCQKKHLFRVEFVYCRLLDCRTVCLELRHCESEKMVGEMRQRASDLEVRGSMPRWQVIVEALLVMSQRALRSRRLFFGANRKTP